MYSAPIKCTIECVDVISMKHCRGFLKYWADELILNIQPICRALSRFITWLWSSFVDVYLITVSILTLYTRCCLLDPTTSRLGVTLDLLFLWLPTSMAQKLSMYDPGDALVHIDISSNSPTSCLWPTMMPPSASWSIGFRADSCHIRGWNDNGCIHCMTRFVMRYYLKIKQNRARNYKTGMVQTVITYPRNGKLQSSLFWFPVSPTSCMSCPTDLNHF